MRIIVSPAKKMRDELDSLEPRQLPCLLPQTEQLLELLRAMPYAGLKKLLACNDAIARQNWQRYQEMDLRRRLSPALLAYDGIQYKYMAPQVFERPYFEYVEDHLRILSGFYGILRPLDGVVPYRLEMQAKLKTDFCSSLYDFWGSKPYSELTKEAGVILNLASGEYSRVIEKHLDPRVAYITCTFGQWEDGKVKEKGVYVKMARGEMVRFMAENAIEEPEEVKRFDRLGYSYSDDLSSPKNYVFLK